MQKNRIYHTKPLDDEERETMKAMASPDYNPKQDEIGYAKYREMLTKNTTKISINISDTDLQDFKEISVASSIPYQTLIQSALHRYLVDYKRRVKKGGILLI